MSRVVAIVLAACTITLAVPVTGASTECSTPLTDDCPSETADVDAPAETEAEQAAVGPKVVVTEERWENQDRRLERQVVVADGGRLVIEDSVIDIHFDQTCSVRINGEGCIGHISVQEDGELVVRNSTFTSTNEPLFERGTIVAEGGKISITDSKLTQFRGVKAQYEGELVFRSNTVTGMLGGVSIIRGASSSIVDNHFSNQSFAVGVQDSSPEIRNNTFEDISAIALRIQQSIVGDKAFTTDPLVVDNVFVDVGQGIFTDSGAGFSIAHNRFEDARFHAIHIRVPTFDGHRTMLDQSPPVVTDNVFEDNHREVRIFTKERDRTAVTSTFEMTGNLIQGTICNHIQAEDNPNATLVVEANDNWWDGGDGPRDPLPNDDDCEALDGSATFEIDSILRAPPLDAGPRIE